MAIVGTIFGLPLSQQWDENGDPHAGALLYLYEAGTSTPVTSHVEYSQTTLNSWPLEADSAGRIPQFWLEDGAYRVRMTTAAGLEIFDITSVQALGPSTGEVGGGGGGDVDATTVFAVGDVLWKPVTGTRTGWVRANARTIGSAASGGTERANADTAPLYDFLWANFSDALCPVATGRGASSAADFAANKAIGTLDMRGRGPFGLDDMGNSAAGVISGGTTAGGTTGSSSGTFGTYTAASWTPAAAFGGSSTGVTYSTQVGRYTKIDNLVTVWGVLVLTNNGSGTGAATITGLPFAATTLSGMQFQGQLSGSSISASNDGFTCAVASGASAISLYQNGGGATLTETEIVNTATLYFSVSYRTDTTTAGTDGTVAAPDWRLGSWYFKL